jgi:hypothetical protein
MNNHSNWIKTDLHIHSIESNKYKKNDYKSNEYTGEEIIQVLTSNSVGLFSVTDHNCVNKKLYKEIFEVLKKEHYSAQINILIGTEIDVLDISLHQERIHVLCIFESRDIDRIAIAIDELTKDIQIDIYPTVKKIFETLEKYQLYRFILIPHFNNKSNSLPSSDKQIENLNRLIFNAYEDANNHVKLGASLKVYLKEGLENFPFIAFSDNHNLEEYPGWKDEDKKTEKLSLCSILGDIHYPYNTIKTAFEEPRLRISIDNVELMRSTRISYKHVSFQNGDKIVGMSPYMNTIIGPFGSGKSFIFNKILNGIKSMPSKYKLIIESTSDEFLLNINGTKVSSLKEAARQQLINKIITIDQYEELVYIDKIDNKYIQRLSEKLDFNIPKLNSFVYDFDTTILKKNVDEILNANKEFSNSYLFNYEKAFSFSESYTIHKSESVSKKISYQNIIDSIGENNYMSIKKLNILNIDIFNEEDQKIIDNFGSLINRKKSLILLLEESINDIRVYLNDSIDTFNENNDFKNSKTTKEQVKEIVYSYNQKLITLLQNANLFCKKFDNEKYEELLSKDDKVEFDDYIITCKYNIGEKTFEDINSKMFSAVHKKDSFVKSLINSVDNSETVRLKNNKPFTNYLEILDSYKQNAESTFMEANLLYDILVGEKKKSILRFSPGERSQEILKMVFQRIKDGIKRKLRTVVIIDQPENNMDNHNIMTLLVEKIKEVKLTDRDNFILFILVTHNANICITSDSENIIIAKNTNDIFEYTPGSIENENHISDVCEILEGGTEALNARASKYNMNIRRKVN